MNASTRTRSSKRTTIPTVFRAARPGTEADAQTIPSTNAVATSLPQQLAQLRRRVARFGVSRHSVLVASRRLYPHSATTPLRRLSALIAGSSMIGVAVAMLVQARLGLSPYDVMVSGVVNVVPLTFGQTIWLCSAVLFGLAALLGEYPSRWGLAYVFSVGLAIDAASNILNRPVELWGRMVFVGGAVLLISTGVSLVVHSGSTGGSLELLMRAGEVRGISRIVVRTALEVGALTLGVALGGSIGPATVIVALSVGPMLGLVGQALEDHRDGRQLRLAAAAAIAAVDDADSVDRAASAEPVLAV